MTEHQRRLFSARDILLLTMLWLAGVNLRITLLAVPPVLPRIVRDLGLDPEGVGALSSLPVLLLSLAATGGSLLVAKLGARRALVVGLLTVGTGSALRGAGSSVIVLFSMTWVMGAGVAMMQTTMPTVTRAWCPAYAGFATAIYANGLLLGEVFSASLTIPYVLPMLGSSWEWSLFAWSIPAFIAAVGVLLFTREETRAGNEEATWWPRWNDLTVWKAGLIMSGSGSLYFSANAFIPELLTLRGEAELVGLSLTALNAGQLPSSILLVAYGSRLLARRLPVVIAGLLSSLGIIGLVLTTGWIMITAAALVGVGTAYILIWSLSLPAIVAPDAEVQRLSAGVFTIGYLGTFLSPLIGGMLWGWSGIPETSLVPAALTLIVCMVSVTTLRIRPVLSKRI